MISSSSRASLSSWKNNNNYQTDTPTESRKSNIHKFKKFRSSTIRSSTQQPQQFNEPYQANIYTILNELQRMTNKEIQIQANILAFTIIQKYDFNLLQLQRNELIFLISRILLSKKLQNLESQMVRSTANFNETLKSNKENRNFFKSSMKQSQFLEEFPHNNNLQFNGSSNPFLQRSRQTQSMRPSVNQNMISSQNFSSTINPLSMTQQRKQKELQIDIDFTDLFEDMKREAAKSKCKNCEKIGMSYSDMIETLQNYLLQKEQTIANLEKQGQQQYQYIEALTQDLNKMNSIFLQMQSKNKELQKETVELNEHLFAANRDLEKEQAKIDDLKQAVQELLEKNNELNMHIDYADKDKESLLEQIKLLHREKDQIKKMAQNGIQAVEDEKRELKQICQHLESALTSRRQSVEPEQDMDEVLRRCLYIQALSIQRDLLE